MPVGYNWVSYNKSGLTKEWQTKMINMLKLIHEKGIEGLEIYMMKFHPGPTV